MIFPFDPIERSKFVENLVMDGDRRRYYRFRWAKFYGTKWIITADATGCNILCAYCWNYDKNSAIESCEDKFYSPEIVAEKIKALMDKHGTKSYRVSGCEAFLGRSSAKHLGKIIKIVGNSSIVETNALMIGYDPSLLDFILKNAHFRVTIKADSHEGFEKTTGARASAYKYQIAAIKALTESNRPFTIALMRQFVDIDKLSIELVKADIDFGEKMPGVDIEGLLYYTQSTKGMKERGVAPLYR